MAFWLAFFLWVGFTVIGELLRPRPKFGAPSPSGIGDLRVPTAEAGRPIPVVFGTVKLRAPNVVWYGDLIVAAIKKKVKTGLFSSQKVTTGYRYNLGQQLVLCHGPIDEVTEIRFDDRAIPSGSVNVTNNINKIIFGNGPPPWTTALIPPGTYTNLTTLARAAETAMQTAIGFATWRVAYGYEVAAGVSDEIHYAVRITGGAATDRTATIVPGIYQSGAAFADAIALALNTKEATEGGGARVSFSCIYDGQGFTLTAHLLRDGFDAWKANGVVSNYNTSASVLMGKQMGTDVTIVGFPTSWSSDYPTGPRRFVFGFAGLAGELGLSNGAGGIFTSAGLWGLSTGADVTVRSKMADADRELPGVTVTDATDKTTFGINAPTLFGGEEREGGIVGTLEVYKGTQTQTANDYLQSVIGAALPAYFGIAYAVARRMYVGTSAYLKLIAFVVRRCPNTLGLAGGRENISGDANPACMIHEIMTNTAWGCAMPAALVDVGSFVEAADTLFEEGMGLSMVFDGQSTAKELIAEILRHVDGVTYTDPATGKQRLKLARPDYNVEDLTRMDPSSVRGCKMAVPSWGDTRNVVKIRYVDRGENFSERVAQAQDLASIQAQGGEVSEEEFAFRGLSTAAGAQRAAARVLRTVSFPLKAFELDTNRTAWRFAPGEVFRLTWPDYQIEDMPCRVTRIRDGDPRDGRIMVDTTQDIYGVRWLAYAPPAATSWVDPIGIPGPLEAQALVECPFAMVVGPERLALALAAPGNPAAAGVQVWSDPEGSNYALTNEIRELTPTGILSGGSGSGGIGYVETSIRVEAGPLMETLMPPSAADFEQGGSVFLIDGELIAWQFMSANSDGSYTFTGLVRGVMDTTPVPHAPGARVWFISEGGGLVTEAAYSADTTVRVKLVPYSSLGVRSLAESEELSLVLASRALKPYVPTNFKVNAVSYPAFISGAFAMTWSHRNRLGTWGYGDAGATASPEVGTTYTIRLYDQTNVLRRTYSGLTGTSQTWTTEDADSGITGLNSVVRVEMEAVVAGLTSFQMINLLVWRRMTESGRLIDAVRRMETARRRRPKWRG